MVQVGVKKNTFTRGYNGNGAECRSKEGQERVLKIRGDGSRVLKSVQVAEGEGSYGNVRKDLVR